MDNLISIVTVNYNTTLFLEVMLKSFEQLTHRPWEMIICDNGSSQKEITRLCSVIKNRPNVSLYLREQSQAGSIGHAEAMDFLVSKARGEGVQNSVSGS